MKIGLWTQGIDILLWPAQLIRLVALVAAAPTLAIVGLVDLNLGFVLSWPLVLFCNHLLGFAVLGKLQKLKRLIKSQKVSSRRTLFLCAGAATLGSFTGTVSAADLRIRRRTLELENLPRELKGLRIALLADLHRGPAVSQAYLESVIESVNSLRPDFVLMPGDFVSKSAHYLGDLEKVLGKLRPKIATLATLGNHDNSVGTQPCLDALQNAGITTLHNDKIYIDTQGQICERCDAGLCIAGVDDLWSGEPNLAGTLQGIPSQIPVILLSHNPDLAETECDQGHRVTVQLSGHTHGGQIVLPGLGACATASGYGSKYLSGWADGPDWPVFTTTGIGTSTIPVRIGANPEIVLFETV